MKIFVFLDVDGVLNSEETMQRTPDRYRGIDPKNLAVLKELLDEIYEPSIILSSSWKICWKNHGYPNKEGRYLIDALKSIGYQIDDFTCDVEDQPFYRVGWKRGTGIKRYLKEHEHKDYIILDDEHFNFYNEGLYQHFIQTNWKKGLSGEDKLSALDVLKKNLPDFADEENSEETKEHFGKAIKVDYFDDMVNKKSE